MMYFLHSKRGKDRLLVPRSLFLWQGFLGRYFSFSGAGFSDALVPQPPDVAGYLKENNEYFRLIPLQT